MEQNNKIEVVYKKAKVGKRLVAHIIDIGVLFVSSMILFALINMAVTKSGFFIYKQDQLTEIKNQSGLYVNGDNLISYVEDNKTFPTYQDKKNELSTRIDSFYHNSTYFSNDQILKDYRQRKLNATNNGVHLFEEKDGAVVERNVDDVALYSFYKDEYSDHSLGYLVNNSEYFYLTSFSFLTSIVEIVAVVAFSFIILYLVLPLTCFKRGRQTIGMKLEKVGIITVEAENESAGKYVLRFLFMFFVFLPINFVSFLIPTFVSLGMMYISKTNSSLVNYVFNDYMVDVTDQKIYYSALEREEAEIKLKEMSIENRDLTLR